MHLFSTLSYTMYSVRHFMTAFIITIVLIWFYVQFVSVSRYGFYFNHSKKERSKNLDTLRPVSIANKRYHSVVESLMVRNGNERVQRKVTSIADDVINYVGNIKRIADILEQIKKKPENISLFYAAQHEINVYIQSIEGNHINQHRHVTRQPRSSNSLQNNKGNHTRSKNLDGNRTYLIISQPKPVTSRDTKPQMDLSHSLIQHLKKVQPNAYRMLTVFKQQPGSIISRQNVSRIPVKPVPRVKQIDVAENSFRKRYLSRDNSFESPTRFILSKNIEKHENGHLSKYLPQYFVRTQNVSDQQFFVFNQSNEQSIVISSKQYNRKKFAELLDTTKRKFSTAEHTKVQKKIKNQTCNNCFVHDFSYVINNVDICHMNTPNDSVYLFIMIFTRNENIEQRKVIRRTWLTYARQNTGPIRYAFLLGKISNDSLHDQVLQENLEHHDIIEENFIDTYMNLTYKTIMGFKWVVNYCSLTKYVLKTDDDMFINIPNLIHFLQQSGGGLDTVIAGNCYTDATPIRDNSSKWFVSTDKYKEENYPSFCTGTGYVTSIGVIDKIYRVSPSVKYFPFEDVYIGFCLRKIGGKVKRVKGFNSHQPYKPETEACSYKGDSLITAHWITPGQMETIWKAKCEVIP